MINTFNRLMRFNRLIARAFLVLIVVSAPQVQAATKLADQPLVAGKNVPGNVALTISAEFPTALTYAYNDSYSTSNEYLGYFDANKCYVYDFTKSYFKPAAISTAHMCTSQWSGNFLNWATMQSLDPFRQTLTGGNRVIDTSNDTVLEKAWSSGQGGYKNRQKSISGATLITQSTPLPSTWNNFYIRIDMLGNKMWYSGTTSPDITTANTTQAVNTTSVSNASTDDLTNTKTLIYQKLVRVKVCDATIGIESNCTQYPNGNYKPTGLIQQNAFKLRFAAFGYLADPTYMNDNNYTGSYTDAGQSRNQNLQGGVLRAKMASLGPLALGINGSTLDTSASSEWDKSTGIFNTNPDSASASSTASTNGLLSSDVPNSGVINYLNKFGSTTGKYKVYDRTAELYYAATRYFKNLGDVSAYSSMAGYSTTEKKGLVDGFPVITSWDDPIKYRCQTNFILGIGDNNTFFAGNLPGSKSTSGTVPPEVSSDNTVNVSIATNRVGALQGLGNIGNGSDNLMGGLAFDSHTRDIRTDAAMTDMQTISTYWLDVLESGYVANNQYVLATKFGGFDVPTGYQPCSTSAACPFPPTIPTITIGDTTWDKDKNGKPDNYFEANNPANMTISLKKAFDAIVAEADRGSSISFATASTSVQNGSLSYATGYSSDGWIGSLIANKTSVSNSGDITVAFVWNAADTLETQRAGTGWNDARFIATSTCTTNGSGTPTACGAPFRTPNLSSTQLAQLGSDTTAQQSMLYYLRGNPSNEGTTYRKRTKALGDIVNSKVVPVGPPGQPYNDSFNPGYSAFVAAKAGRKTVAYVGANDGMLHAFDGSEAGSNELFAYIPNAVFSGPNATPAIDGIAALASTAYVHHFYVDATPQVTDVNFGADDNDWHSLLVSGLGKGGKSYFAIDVTNPGTLSNEVTLKNAVKWEFSHPHMGYTYDTPLMIKTAKYGWVVVLTSGYNNDNGIGYFFIVNPANGQLLEPPIPVSGSNGSGVDAGLAHVNAFVAYAPSAMADTLYAGDLLGNVWRLDLTGTTGNYPAPVKLATLKAADGTAQPITTSPVIEVDVNTGKRYVFVGTGKLLDPTDLDNTQTQTFYAINDGTSSQFYTADALPTSPTLGKISFPITRSSLISDSPATGIGLSQSQPMGYYVDLGVDTNNKPYLINTEMVSGAGIIIFDANLVNNSNSCSPFGNHSTFALTYGTGKSVLTKTVALADGSGTQKIAADSSSGSDLGASISFVRVTFTDSSGNTVTKLMIRECDGKGNCQNIDPGLTTTKPFTQMNWRELPTTE